MRTCRFCNETNAVTYLVFGSTQVGPSTFDYLNLNPTAGNTVPMPNPAGPPFNQRVGDLCRSATTTKRTRFDQVGFNFDGLTSSTSSGNSQLGASVAGVGDVNGDGIVDFMIGAPGADGGAGRAILIYGSSALNNPNRANKTIDLDNTTLNTDINRVIFTGTAELASWPGGLDRRGLHHRRVD